MKVDVIRNTGDFYARREEWDELLSRSYNDHIFLTHEWLSSWWRVYADGRSLFVLEARDEGRLVGLAPLYGETTGIKSGMPARRLRFLGNVAVGSVFLDLIVDRGCVEDVIRAFWDFLSVQKGWDVLALEQAMAGSPALSILNRFAADDGRPVVLGEEVVSPWMELPATWEEFMDLPDKIFKRIVRREGVKKVSRRHEVEVALALSKEDFDWALRRLFEIHAERWDRAGRKGCFEDARMTSFYREVCGQLHKRGWLRLSSIKIDGVVESMEFGFARNGRYYSLQGGCSERGLELRAGNILQYKIFESLVGNKKEFHFLQGPERYKYQWGCRDQDMASLIVGRGLVGHACILVERLRYLRRRIRKFSTDRREARARRRGSKS